jgi:ribose 5-phosphate isomerase B
MLGTDLMNDAGGAAAIHMSDSLISQTCKPMRIGIAADHGGFELKKHLLKMLRLSSYEVIDFGAHRPESGDDYPDYIVPMARAVASGDIERGVAICGSGVGASLAAGKVRGVRACLIHDAFAAHQGVEDDDLNVICLGGLVIGHALALELVQAFLSARFSGSERHLRRLDTVANLERTEFGFPYAIAIPGYLETDLIAMDAWRNEGDPN